MAFLAVGEIGLVEVALNDVAAVSASDAASRVICIPCPPVPRSGLAMNNAPGSRAAYAISASLSSGRTKELGNRGAFERSLRLFSARASSDLCANRVQPWKSIEVSRSSTRPATRAGSMRKTVMNSWR